MYVKIVEDLGGEFSGGFELIECESAKVVPDYGSTGEDILVLKTKNGPQKQKRKFKRFEGASTILFFLDEAGNTIDSYHW